MDFTNSQSLFQEACELIPGGVNSPVRAFKAVGEFPVFIERGEGAYLYDADGNKLGESRKNFAGGIDHFDATGNKVGHSIKNFAGGMDHYDLSGEKIGSSMRGFWGQTNHFDNTFHKTGEGIRNFWGAIDRYYVDGEG